MYRQFPINFQVNAVSSAIKTKKIAKNKRSKKAEKNNEKIL